MTKLKPAHTPYSVNLNHHYHQSQDSFQLKVSFAQRKVDEGKATVKKCKTLSNGKEREMDSIVFHEGGKYHLPKNLIKKK